MSSVKCGIAKVTVPDPKCCKPVEGIGLFVKKAGCSKSETGINRGIIPPSVIGIKAKNCKSKRAKLLADMVEKVKMMYNERG